MPQSPPPSLVSRISGIVPLSLIGFVFRRVLQAIPLLLAASFFTFYLINQSPGNYLSKYKLNPQITQEYIEREEKRLGLDKPWIVTYLLWLKGIAWGDAPIIGK